MVARDIDFAADNGSDFGFLTGSIEIGCPEKIAMIGDCRSRHAQGVSFLGYIADTYGAVEQTEFRMTVEMHKIRHKRTP